ncbi:MAG: J domain-containing protein [Phycisphaerales bacterium]|nr:J domain-containing protein [Phycisphaerales bacterium]
MPIKDHYKTLEISAHASLLEIKKAYRHLALKYHPDKNNSEERATLIFQEIQAAYEVLSNPLKRCSYDQELKQIGKYSAFAKDNLNTSEQILKQSKDLYVYIHSNDNKVINNDALADFVLALLSNENMNLLLRNNDSQINDGITSNILLSCKGIVAYRLFAAIAEQLFLLQSNSTSPLHQQIVAELASRKAKQTQNKIVPYAALGIIFLVIVAMCLILLT